MVETPAYDLTVFKIHYGKLVLKVYSKGERGPRIEAIIENTKDLGVRRSVDEFPAIVRRLREMLERFLDSLYCLEVLVAVSDGATSAPAPFATRSPGLFLLPHHRRTVLAVKGPLRRAQQRRALDRSGPF